MAKWIWVTIGSGNGLLPNGTKQMLLFLSVRISDTYLEAISQETPEPSLTKISMKITYQKFNSNVSWANVLTSLYVGDLHWFWPFDTVTPP